MRLRLRVNVKLRIILIIKEITQRRLYNGDIAATLACLANVDQQHQQQQE